MSQKKIINIADSITVDELAGVLNLPVTTLIGELFKNGIVATINQRIDFETAVILTEELGFNNVKLKRKAKNDEVTSRLNKMHEVSENAQPRPPIVAVMGHVDHGKTTLLDTILGTKQFLVRLVELHNIFQRIKLSEKGERLLARHSWTRGFCSASTTRSNFNRCCYLLSFAADDGVKPQTIEAIRFAQNANAKIVVAINKNG